MKTSRSVRQLFALSLPLVIGCGRNDEAWRTRLADPDPSVRRSAVHDVASAVEPPTAVPVLKAALQDTDDKVRVAAALALLEIDPRNADCRPEIESALQSGQGPAFIAAGSAGRDAEWAVPTLVKLLDDRKTTVRALAAKTLGEIGATSEQVDAALRRKLRDENSSVRNASQKALERLQPGANASSTAR